MNPQDHNWDCRFGIKKEDFAHPAYLVFVGVVLLLMGFVFIF